MDPAFYVRQRQILWAKRRGLKLQGSAGERGLAAYTNTVDENLFQSLSQETRSEFENADGNELKGNPCKMQAVHSTAALACNLFHYWRTHGTLSPITRACELPTANVQALNFEVKCPICEAVNRRNFPHDPNIDVVFDYGPGSKPKLSAVECKFTEVFREHGGIKPAYLKADGLWHGLPHGRELAATICPNDGEFEYLHAAQLLKHILGLKQACGVQGFRLLYLWYVVPGEPGVRHEQEVKRFHEVVAQDGIKFQATTYQEVILKLAERERDRHAAYIDYMAERYL